MDNYFYPNKSANKTENPALKGLKVSLPPEHQQHQPKTDTSLSSLPTSVAEESQRYFWDSFDLNNDPATVTAAANAAAAAAAAGVAAATKMAQEAGDSMARQSADFAANTSTLPPAGKPVDPTRDIETLVEDTADIVSRADTEDDGPQLHGSVYPTAAQPQSKSIEELLALEDDLQFADSDHNNGLGGGCNGEMDNAYDYHLHLNNYLPTYNVSETDQSDEQTPMLAAGNAKMKNNANRNVDLDTSSEMNGSIAALPEDAGSNNCHNGDLDNLCELEDSDEDCDNVNVTAAATGSKSSVRNPRVTRV
jgi:hypothetical protein